MGGGAGGGGGARGESGGQGGGRREAAMVKTSDRCRGASVRIPTPRRRRLGLRAGTAYRAARPEPRPPAAPGQGREWSRQCRARARICENPVLGIGPQTPYRRE